MSLLAPAKRIKSGGMVLYTSIADSLRQEILTQYQPADMLPTQRDLANRFKASSVTVGNALQQLVQEGLITRTPGVGTVVNNPKTLSRGLVGILNACGDPTYVSQLFGTIELELRQARYRPIVFGSSGVYEEELNALNEMGRFNEVGLILYSSFVPKLLEETENIARHKIPVVTINHPYGNLDCARIDHLQLGVLQAKHLLEQSCRRILYIDVAGKTDENSPWLNGFLSLLIRESHGQPSVRFAALHHKEGATPAECDIAAIQHVTDVTRKAFDNHDDPAPDAVVVCGGDQYLPSVVETLKEFNLEPGRDVLLVGHENQEIRGFPYVTVDGCLSEIGHHATRLLLERIDNKYSGPARIHTVPPKLIHYD